MNTFSLDFLRSALIEREAFIYHGAGFAKGSGTPETNALPYLDRLKRAIDYDLEICCSTVRSGDSESNLDYWGRIGLILWPRSANSITLVSASDAGTLPDPQRPGRRFIPRLPITGRALVESIDQRPRGTANEWCLLDYEVVGIFIEPPIQYTDGEECREVLVSDVFEEFSTLKVFRQDQNRLYEVLQCGNLGQPVSIEELYPYRAAV